MRRVVVTGIGIAAPNGLGRDNFWNNCLSEKCAAQPIPSHWREFGTYESGLWAPLPSIDYNQLGISKIEQFQLDKSSMLAVICAEEALSCAGLSPVLEDTKRSIYKIGQIDSTRTGVFAGTGAGGITSLISAHSSHVLMHCREIVKSVAEGKILNSSRAALTTVLRLMQTAPRLNPYTVSMLMPNAVANLLGIRFSLSGVNRAVCCACSSGASALGAAFRSIAGGETDSALAGGCEYLADEYGGVFKAFDSAGTLTKEVSPQNYKAPFDSNRSGFLFSEGGAAFLFLEELDHALKRDAPVLAEISSFQESFEGYHLMMMEPDGKTIENILRSLLRQSDLDAREVEYINTHGTGTLCNDKIESAKIEEVFGNDVVVNSTKGLTGHTLGASGALEAAVCVLSIRDQIVHGSPNLFDPLTSLNIARNTTPVSVNNAISLSFAFGGNMSGLLFKKFEQ